MTERSSQNSDDGVKENVYTYTFNRLNLPLTMTGNGVTTTYTYNNIGNLLKEELTNGVIKEYNYDSNGNRISFKVTRNGVEEINTTYSYDMLDRLENVTNEDNVSSYTYNKDGEILTETTNGYVTAYTYNRGGWVTGIETANGSEIIQSHSYSYYPDGNIAKKESLVGEESIDTDYEYDDAGRLIKEITGEESIIYSYDPFGNRASLTNGARIENYTYDLNNRLTKKVTDENGTKEQIYYTYDNNGNQLSRMKSSIHSKNGVESITLSGETDGEEYATFGYDPYNRLTYYTNGVTTANYTYDGNNLRQSKTVNGITTTHIWDGTDIVMDIGGTTNKYYRGLTGINYADLGGTLSYYHKNAHGDITALTNTNGQIVNNYQFDAFGQQLNETENTNPFGYAGEYVDSETGMIYLRNRYYEPTTGRFITEDPIRDGVNWYSYCCGNPVAHTDPSGLSSEERLGEGIWSFKNDKFGVSILSHWLFGGGVDYVKKNGMWGIYMKDNFLLKSKVQKIVLPLADDVKNNSSKTVDITTSMVIQNGEDIIGYQYLHGTNADVGGFQIKGTVSKNKKGDTTYDLIYTWNDKIDPNFMYYSDSKKAEFAKSIPLANPKDYTIRITWSDKTVIKAKPTWYNWNTGWLK